MMNIELIEYKISISTPFNIYVTKKEVAYYMSYYGLSFKRELVYSEEDPNDFIVRFFLANGHKIFVQNSNLIAYKVPFIDKYGFLSEIEMETAINSEKYIEILSVIGGFSQGEVKEVEFADIVMLLQKYVEYRGVKYNNDMNMDEFSRTLNIDVLTDYTE